MAEKLLQSLGSECVKLSDHIDVVATCANHHKEEVQKYHNLLITDSQPKELSSAVSFLLQVSNENWDKIKNLGETSSILIKDIIYFLTQYPRSGKTKLIKTKRMSKDYSYWKTA